MQTFLVLPVAQSTSQFLVRAAGTLTTWGGAAEVTCPQAQRTVLAEPALRASHRRRRVPAAAELSSSVCSRVDPWRKDVYYIPSALHAPSGGTRRSLRPKAS